LCVLSMHSSRGSLRTGASEDRWMVIPGCDEWLTTWCGLTLSQVLQVQVAAWFALVQVKSGRERSMPCGASEESRPDSRDPVDSGVKCGPHGGKKSKTKSSIEASAG
jgi:hypothetical protein